MMAGLHIRNLVSGYPRRAVIRDLSVDVGAGCVTALVGPNGSGKSTLLRAIAGLLPATGVIALADQSLMQAPLAARARRVAFLPQSSMANTSLLVLEAAIAALRVTATAIDLPDRHDARRRALAALERLGIANLAFEPLSQLSGGQRQLAALAQVITRETPLVLLDEPTSALDLRGQLEVMAIIRDLARRGAVVIVVLHDLGLAARWADEVIVLDRGEVHTAGPPTTAITRDMLSEVCGIEARIETCSQGGLNVIAVRPLSGILGTRKSNG